MASSAKTNVLVCVSWILAGKGTENIDHDRVEK